ncbi:MAG: hypothetical protein JWN32_2324, partial [Solirubrobacterales bacterium]|nr:hypothetical protein [Solirubrobacterales bacterium]
MRRASVPRHDGRVSSHEPSRPSLRGKLSAALAAACLLGGLCSAAPVGAAGKVSRAKVADRAKNADNVDKLSASKTPKQGELLALDATGKFPIGVIPVSAFPKAPTYSAGFGLGLAGNTFVADPGVLQRRVGSLCQVGQAIREIKEDGGVTCQAITADSGGDITAVGAAAGSGLTGGGATGDVSLGTDFNTLQKRISACAVNQFVTAVAASGVPTCAVVVQSITSGAGITKTGTAAVPVLAADTSYLQRRVASTCAVGSAIRAIAQDGTPTCEATPAPTTTSAYAMVSGAGVVDLAHSKGIAQSNVQRGDTGLYCFYNIPSVKNAVATTDVWGA